LQNLPDGLVYCRMGTLKEYFNPTVRKKQNTKAVLCMISYPQKNGPDLFRAIF